MTDKQIIVDGVDVSECNYAILPKKQCPMKSMPYAKETSCIACKEHNTKRNFCKNNPNCYFKQLKHKEKEFKELKEKQKELLHDCNSCKFHQYKQAELKLEEIKEIVVPIKKNTCFGMHCGVINWILKIIEGTTDINNIVSDTVHIQKIGDVTVKDGE